jgi:hypothetical protein
LQNILTVNLELDQIQNWWIKLNKICCPKILVLASMISLSWMKPRNFCKRLFCYQS